MDRFANKLGASTRSPGSKKMNENTRSVIYILIGILFGFFIGKSFPTLSITKIHLPSRLLPSVEVRCSEKVKIKRIAVGPTELNSVHLQESKNISSIQDRNTIWVPTNPRGAERLPPRIVVADSDLYPRRLWGNPNEDLAIRPRYLVTFTVGIAQKQNINAAVKKFSTNFTILLFHYDGKTTEWDEFEWSKRAIHVSVQKQTKWWYAKRFLHPDIVASYDYIFMWDEDLGVTHFDAEEYIRIVRKHGLEISQPALDPHSRGLTWHMTKRVANQEIHKEAEERPGWCPKLHMPPCAAFVEIMAPVFSKAAWRCLWYILQNDLVHGWGLDFALRRCVEEPAYEKIGVVDSQWIVHQGIPSLGDQGEATQGKQPWQGVRERCNNEWGMFRKRLDDADDAYFRGERNQPSVQWSS